MMMLASFSSLWAIGLRASVSCGLSTGSLFSTLPHDLSQYGSFPPQSEKRIESPSKADAAILGIMEVTFCHLCHVLLVRSIKDGIVIAPNGPRIFHDDRHSKCF